MLTVFLNMKTFIIVLIWEMENNAWMEEKCKIILIIINYFFFCRKCLFIMFNLVKIKTSDYDKDYSKTKVVLN